MNPKLWAFLFFKPQKGEKRGRVKEGRKGFWKEIGEEERNSES